MYIKKVFLLLALSGYCFADQTIIEVLDSRIQQTVAYQNSMFVKMKDSLTSNDTIKNSSKNSTYISSLINVRNYMIKEGSNNTEALIKAHNDVIAQELVKARNEVAAAKENIGILLINGASYYSLRNDYNECQRKKGVVKGLDASIQTVYEILLNHTN